MSPFKMRSALSLYFAIFVCFSFQAQVIAGGQDDQGVATALEGLPGDVLSHVLLVPRAKPIPKITPDDPLGVALRMALLISDDEDVRNRLLYQCARQAIRKGATATAKEIAEQVTDYRAVLLLLQIAEKDEAVDRKRAQGILDTAIAMVRRVKPWQADLILVQLIKTGARLDVNQDVINGWYDSILDDENKLYASADMLVLRAEKTGRFELGELKGMIQKTAKARPLPGLLNVARELYDLALLKYQSKDQQDQAQANVLVDMGTELLSHANVVCAEVLLDAAADFYQASHEDVSKRLFEVAESCYGAPNEEMTRLNYKLVYLWKLRGKTEAMLPVLEAVEKNTQRLEQMYLPFAYSWVAATWALLEKTERAERLELKAIQQAVTNVNPRTRLVGVVDICLCHSETRRNLSAGVFAMINQLLSGEGGK